MQQSAAIKNIKRNASILLSGNIGANILALLSLSVFTYSQGVELFGYYILVLTCVEIVSKIFVVDTWQAVIKFVPEFEKEDKQELLLMFLKLSFILEFLSLLLAAALLLSFGDLLFEFFNVPDRYWHELKLLMTVIIFQGLEISTGIFRVFNKFSVQVRILIYSAGLKLLVFMFLSLLKADFSYFIYGAVFVQFVTFVMRLWMLLSLMKQKEIGLPKVLSSRVDRSTLKAHRVFPFIVYNNLSISVRMVSRQFDSVVIGKLLGPEVVGLYRIAKEVANIISRLTDPIYQSIYPEFSRLLSQNKKSEAKRIAKKIAFYIGLVGLFFYVVFFLFGEWGIGMAFGEEFKAAYPIALVYFIAIFIAMISLPIVPLMLSLGMAKQAFWNQLNATLVYCAVLYPLVFHYSAIGAAIAYILFYVVWLLYSWRAVSKINWL